MAGLPQKVLDIASKKSIHFAAQLDKVTDRAAQIRQKRRSAESGESAAEEQ